MGVTLSNVNKSFGAVQVIHDVSLDIPTGEFAVFVGPSGCGKSTLLRMIAGLEDTTGGRIAIDGTDVTDIEPAARGVAMVFQSYALYPHLTVFDNMAFSLRLSRTPGARMQEMVREAARILQLEDQLDKKPSQLSGGQRQRVAIGRAIVRKPKVFLFDEPLSNLDAELRVQMRLELTRLHKQIGATMIYVTHDQVEAMTLADKIFVLREGVLQQSGPPLNLYDDPDNRFVGGFIGSPAMNFLPATVQGHSNGVADVSVKAAPELALRAGVSAPLSEGQRVTLGIRPEHLVIGDGGLPAEIEVAEELGDVAFLYARLPDGHELIVKKDGSREQLTGQKVGFMADPNHVLVFDEEGQRLR